MENIKMFVNKVRRFENIALNVFHLISRFIVMFMVLLGGASVVIAALLIWDMPITEENVRFVIKEVPHTWIFFFSLFYVMWSSTNNLHSWRVKPVERVE